MEPEILNAFIEEAAAEMPAIRRGLLTYSRQSDQATDLGLPLESVRMIRSGCEIFQLTGVDVCSAALEAGITALMSAEVQDKQGYSAHVLDLLAALEESLVQLDLGAGESAIDLSAFVDDSFDLLQFGSETTSIDDMRAENDDALMGFDIDDELIEVFALEAECLLQNIESSLGELSRNPQDRDALWEIRRNAHTFKGAAGIVGLKKQSKLAHRIEDLLVRMADMGTGSADGLFELLRHSTDCLQLMTNGENSDQLERRVQDVYLEFDRVLASLSVSQNENQPTTVDSRIAIPFQVEIVPVAKVARNEDRSIKQVQAKGTIVRVPLVRLDNLVRISRDLLVGRSVFEQRLKDLEQQIDELHNATRRLQNTSGKLEIDFEASMLSSRSGSQYGLGSAVRSFGAPDSKSFDDLEFDRYTDFHQSTRQLSEAIGDTLAINNALDSVRNSFETLFDHQRKLVEEMQEKLMQIRMVEFGSLATRLQRIVTGTCEEESKKVRLLIENENLELDTQIVDALTEPLLHLLKNAVVHGIEQPHTRRLLGKPEIGEIKLRVVNEETHVVLTLSDDGRGIAASGIKEKAVEGGYITEAEAEAMIDEDAYDLIFLPGLTTAEKLNLSAGRGVGMSIVRQSIEAGKGTISIRSSARAGTSFTLRLPLTLAITNVLLVKTGRQITAIPLKLIRHIGELGGTEIIGDKRGFTVEVGPAKVPLKFLAEMIGQFAPAEYASAHFISIQIETDDTMFVVAVDEILRTEEVVIKPLGHPLEKVKGIIGAAILGNGELVSILDIPYLLNRKTPQIKQSEIHQTSNAELTVMVVDDSPSVRHMTSKMIANAGWIVTAAKDGLDALEQLKLGAILPDLILSDIEMPRMDGYELVSSLRRNETFANIPVIMITSRSGGKHREKAFETGVSEYLTKPFEENELIATIRKLTSVAV